MFLSYRISPGSNKSRKISLSQNPIPVRIAANRDRRIFNKETTALSYGASNRVIELVQYGLGGVGKALLEQVVQNAPAILNRLGIDLRYRALIDSTTVLHVEENAALSRQHMQHLIAGLKSGQERLADL